MKTRILFPTDFSRNGIKVMEQIAQSELQNFELLFTHLFYLPDGIQDLLFSMYRVKEHDVVAPEFTTAYRRLLRTKFTEEELHAFPVKFFYGNTLVFFRRFLEANRINAVIWSSQYPCGKINKASIDAHDVIKKCGLKVIDPDKLTIIQPSHVHYAAEEQYSF